MYKKLENQHVLEGHSDTGFRREDDVEADTYEGKSLRGANFVNIGKKTGHTTPVHLLDWVCGMVKQVVRSTFTSAGDGVLATMDQA